MFLQSLLVLSQRVARLVSNVRASTRTSYLNGPSKHAGLPSRNGTHVAPTAPLDAPSKLATDPLRDKADWPLTARFDEHRPKCNNKFHHACALGEHKRSTAFVFPLPACALREHRSDMRVVPSPSRASILFAMGFTNKGCVFNNN